MSSPWSHRAARWLLSCLVLQLPAVLWAQEGVPADWPGRVGRLVEVQGVVRLLDRTDNEWVGAVQNRPLTTGDHLVTEPGARAELRVGSTTVRLDGATDLELRRLDDQAIVLQLNAGSLALKVVSQELLSQVEVVTVEGRFRPREPGHYRIDRRDDASEASNWRGELEFEGRDSSLVIAAGRRAELWLKGPAQVTHYNWNEIERDAFADWVAFDDTHAERSVTARYVSPEMTGWEDLDRHGSWQTHPEYGGVWIPTTVAVGWAPYRSGHWAWIAPWGWTWVDNARWGFAPFHYGRWVWWGKRWCWAPGQRVHKPHFAPALVGWLGGTQLVVGGRVGGRVGSPPVAWVPLGPRDPYRPHPGWQDRAGRVDRGDRPDERDERTADRQRRPDLPTRPTGGGLAGAVTYTHQGVPGAVTAVTPDAFAHRRPVTPLPVTLSPRQPVPGVAAPAGPPPGVRPALPPVPPLPPTVDPTARMRLPPAPTRDGSAVPTRQLPVPPATPAPVLPQPSLPTRQEPGVRTEGSTRQPAAPPRVAPSVRHDTSREPPPGLPQRQVAPPPQPVIVTAPPAAPAPAPVMRPAPVPAPAVVPASPGRAAPPPTPATPTPAPAPARARPETERENTDNRQRGPDSRSGPRQVPSQ